MAAELTKNLEFTPEELDDLVENCFNFIEMMCFAPPATGFYPYQAEFARCVIKDILSSLGNSITGLFSRQSGKSETVACIAAGMMVLLPKLANMKKDGREFVFPQLKNFISGYKVGIFAPSNLQSTTTFSRTRDRITAHHARVFVDSEEFATKPNPKSGRVSLWPFLANSREFMELANGSLCMQMTADKSAKIESKTYHLILLDESQELDATVVGKSIMPMGASTNATTVATGTPGTTKGYFYKMIELNEKDKLGETDRNRAERRLQPQLHFAYNYEEVQKWNPNYAKYIIKEKRKIGEDSDEFQQAYNLKWMLERGMAVPEHLFDELTIKSRNITTHDNTQTEYVAGLDWGKSQDSTVLTVGKPRWDLVDESGKCPIEVVYWWEKLGDNYEEIFAELKIQLKQFNIRTLACDGTGSGEPLSDRLMWELQHITVLPVRFTSQSKDHLYKWFMLMLQERKCDWPGHARVRDRKYWQKFKLQMLDLQKEYKNGYLTCHAPEDQKHAHDDFPDSLALMMWCINAEAMPFIQEDEGTFYSNDHSWHKTPQGRNAPGGGFSLRG